MTTLINQFNIANTATPTLAQLTVTGNVSGGNLITLGLVSATGNVSGGNLITAGVVDANNGVFSGNVTASKFIGNIDAGGSNTQVQFNDDDVLAGSAGFTFDKTGNQLTITGNIDGANITASAGIAAGTTVTATGNVSGGNVVTAGDVTTATVTVSGNITTGNILTDGYYYANGDPFAGGGGGTVTVANTAPVGPSQGDIWIDSDTAIQYIYFDDGNSSQWAEMEAQLSISTGSGAVDLSAVDQDIVPATNATYSLGNATNRWANLYLVGNTIDLGGAQIKADAASGAFAFVPAPTDAQPDPVATVISATGGITSVETTGGEISSNVIAEAAATSSDAVYIFPTQITGNVTVAANTNALSVGPITQSANTVITISSGQRWIIL